MVAIKSVNHRTHSSWTLFTQLVTDGSMIPAGSESAMNQAVSMADDLA